MYKSQLQLEQQKAEHRLEMIKNMNDTQEKERSIIAKNIHDHIGASFFSARMFAGELANNCNDEELKSTAQKIESLISNGYDDLRKTIQSLSPIFIEKFGFIEGIQEFLNIIDGTANIKFHMEVVGEFEDIKKENQISIYRVIQECINNSIKHSKCNNINLSLEHNNEFLNLIIKDDGEGFNYDNSIKTTGLGLRNIENRISLLEGKLDLETSLGKGVKYEFSIPNKNL